MKSEEPYPPAKELVQGQSIIEILVAVAIGALLVIGATGIIAPVLRANTQAGRVQAASALAKELTDNIHVWAERDWHNVLNLATSSANKYYLNATSSPFSAATGTESVAITTSTYSRYFYIDDVQRDSGGTIVSSGGFNDPSTKQITVGYNWPQGVTTTLSFYLTRYRNNVYDQTDWSGGTGQNGPATTTNNQFASSTANIVYASTTGSILLTLPASTGAVGAWATTAPMPRALSALSSVAHNGYIYTTGGLAGSGTSTVLQALINADGSLGTWVMASSSLPSILYGHSAVAYNGYIYTTGGCGSDCNNNTSTVFQVPINSNGSLGTWVQASSSLPNAIKFHSAVAYNGYLYTTGGWIGFYGATSTVNQARINADGSLGTWVMASSSLPSAIYGHSAVAYNGYIYTTGGNDSSGFQTTTVFQVPIHADGSLGTWVNASNSLPSAIQEHSAVAYNGYLYTTGGYHAGPTSTVFQAPINANGSLGTWVTASSSLPGPINNQSAVVYNGYIYTTGGTSTVFYAPLQ